MQYACPICVRPIHAFVDCPFVRKNECEIEQVIEQVNAAHKFLLMCNASTVYDTLFTSLIITLITIAKLDD